MTRASVYYRLVNLRYVSIYVGVVHAVIYVGTLGLIEPFVLADLENFAVALII
jgi:hypothetical protein